MNYIPLNEQEAWSSLMVVVARIDGTLSERESLIIGETCAFKYFFDNHDILNYAQKTINWFNTYGAISVINGCIPLIKNENIFTVFCTLIDVVICDGEINNQEKEILKLHSKRIKN